jgi:hypothetical protein
VQLPNHAPLAVAEQFGTLEALQAPDADHRDPCKLRPAGIHAQEGQHGRAGQVLRALVGQGQRGDLVGAGRPADAQVDPARGSRSGRAGGASASGQTAKEASGHAKTAGTATPPSYRQRAAQ